jgi:Zn-dependent membrane protease YugP
MHLIILGIALIALIVGPGMWVKSVMRRYQQPADRYAKTGGQIARELLDSQALRNVRTEVTEKGDHYDPIAKVVRLSPENFNGRSLTAIAVAAHEVGHAMQDARGFGPLKWRTRLVHWVTPIEKLGAGMLMISPLTAAFSHSRAIGMLTFFAGLLTLGSSVMVHVLTLPTEFDASFGRALPLLEKRGLLRTGDEPRARRLLRAAALTYVSSALQTLMNIARWWAILRRR